MRFNSFSTILVSIVSFDFFTYNTAQSHFRPYFGIPKDWTTNISWIRFETLVLVSISIKCLISSTKKINLMNHMNHLRLLQWRLHIKILIRMKSSNIQFRTNIKKGCLRDILTFLTSHRVMQHSMFRSRQKTSWYRGRRLDVLTPQQEPNFIDPNPNNWFNEFNLNW